MKKTSAVVLYNNHNTIKICGSIIDAFEYYFIILENNPNIKLYMINFNKPFMDFLFNIIEDRYNLKGLQWKENIVNLEGYQIVRTVFDHVLIVDYSTIKKLKGLVKTDKTIIITELHSDFSEYMFDKKLYNTKCYSEMPFEYKDGDKPYKIKLLFDRFKKLKNVKKGIYIQSPSNPDLESIPLKLNLDLSKPIFYKKEDHMKNMFSYFDEYIYYHVNKYFDPHPRLPLECTFYNKSVKYIRSEETDKIDGSYYRFKDLEENGLEDRNLTKNDEIVQQFI